MKAIEAGSLGDVSVNTIFVFLCITYHNVQEERREDFAHHASHLRRKSDQERS